MEIMTVTGNIGRDAETKQTQSGSVTSFSVAASGRNDVTTWYRCSLWGTRGEKLARYLTKGGRVTVIGAFEASVYEGKPDLKINVSDVALQGGKQASGDDGGAAHEPRRATGSAFAAQDLDDEIGF